MIAGTPLALLTRCQKARSASSGASGTGIQERRSQIALAGQGID
ncbi:hypothetical protein ACVXHA_01210 [Escherichia coli]